MIRYERRHEGLAPWSRFWGRMGSHAFIALAVIAGSLGAGMAGYRAFERMSWVDALLNASMILGGMGPVDTLHTDAGKVFAACYALYSGIVFLLVAGLLFAPIYHRFLHHFHLEMEEGPERPRRSGRRAT